MDKSLPTLCDNHCCTACSACVNSCKYDAIEMMEDERGELHPVIDKSICVRCGLCEKVCPELSENNPCKYDRPEVYCCWLKSVENRKQSTSGGAGYAIACAVVKKGGHVWGAAYDENMIVRYIEANSIEELTAIQKSKYVQSVVGGCFQQIKEELKRGELVLFTGTSCHVKGLRSYLRKDYPNLLTIDLVCHGVPGHGVFRKYKEWLEQKYNDRMICFDFRPKRKNGQEKGYCSQATFINMGNKTIEGKDNSELTNEDYQKLQELYNKRPGLLEEQSAAQSAVESAQVTYDDLVSQQTQASSEVDSAQSAVNDAQSKYDSINSQLQQLQKELDNLDD